MGVNKKDAMSYIQDPSTLTEIGIGEEHFADMARGAVAAGLPRGYVPMDEEQAVALYRACL